MTNVPLDEPSRANRSRPDIGPLACRGGPALRVALGLSLLADLAIRVTDLRAFYVDAGMAPCGYGDPNRKS